MHRSRRIQVLTLMATLLVSIVIAAEPSQSPTLSIDVQRVKGKVSPMLYGLMTEEINYSYDGGLYGELLRNRAFEDNRRGQPFHWFVYESGDSDASMTIDTSTGPSAALGLRRHPKTISHLG
jgi:alpha-N-arabinofuranosidase